MKYKSFIIKTLSIAFLIALSGTLIVMFLPNQYEGKFYVKVVPASSQISSIDYEYDGYYGELAAREFRRDLAEIIQTDRFVTDVVAGMKLELLRPASFFKIAKSDSSVISLSYRLKDEKNLEPVYLSFKKELKRIIDDINKKSPENSEYKIQYQKLFTRKISYSPVHIFLLLLAAVFVLGIFILLVEMV